METKVDHQVKKLSGSVVFKLILFSMFSSQKVSLRVLEALLQSAQFAQFTKETPPNAKFNSIRDRICTIDAEFFRQLFERLFDVYNKQLKEEKAVSKADSTYVSIAAKLVSWSMQNGTKSHQQKQVKYSVALKGSLPCSVRIFNEKKFISEDLALGELIATSKTLQESVVVFDRGLQSRKAFEQFTTQDIQFVGRSNPHYNCQVSSTKIPPDKPLSSTVTITKDETGYLSNNDNNRTQNAYRLVSGHLDSTGELICFVTNMLEEDAYEIAAIYKQRWEIEVFFRFIKQHLNATHLVSRQPNGIAVMLYMTMIAATLILTYRKLNKISSFKIAKLKFEIELDNLLIKEIVLLCGGNPNKAAHLWNTS